jgi:hypothetical protein
MNVEWTQLVLTVMRDGIMVNYSEKHYELLADNVKRYLTNVPESITKVELGKAINLIVEMVERESMRDMRQERNK